MPFVEGPGRIPETKKDIGIDFAIRFDFCENNQKKIAGCDTRTSHLAIAELRKVQLDNFAPCDSLMSHLATSRYRTLPLSPVAPCDSKRPLLTPEITLRACGAEVLRRRIIALSRRLWREPPLTLASSRRRDLNRRQSHQPHHSNPTNTGAIPCIIQQMFPHSRQHSLVKRIENWNTHASHVIHIASYEFHLVNKGCRRYQRIYGWAFLAYAFRLAAYPPPFQ